MFCVECEGLSAVEMAKVKLRHITLPFGQVLAIIYSAIIVYLSFVEQQIVPVAIATVLFNLLFAGFGVTYEKTTRQSPSFGLTMYLVSMMNIILIGIFSLSPVFSWLSVLTGVGVGLVVDAALLILGQNLNKMFSDIEN